LSKYRSLIPTLALLIHLADGGRGPVSKTALERAIGWDVYLRSHARRIYSPAVAGGAAAARALAALVLEGRFRDGFVLRDVYRSERSGLATKEDAQAAVDLLVDLDWFKSRDLPTGGRPKRVYRINPKLRPSAPR
jgi:hypothetical protein